MPTPTTDLTGRHTRWVKLSHWVVTLSFFFLVFTGVEIIMVHPRFYWGDAGNDLTPALFELPISRNYKHGGWENRTPFLDQPGSPISASRTYDIFNQNGWGRSLHFLAAWFLVAGGLVYLLLGVFSGHFRKNIWPHIRELQWKLIWQDVKNHLRLQIPEATNGPHYGTLQKISYLIVVFLLLPLMVLTGMTMSPAITAAYPFLLTLFAGAQSARTIHFFVFVVLDLFLLVHLMMIIKSGFKKQIRAMTIG